MKKNEKDLKALTKEEMQKQASQAIEESFDGVWEAMETARKEHEEEDHEHKFKYKLGVALTMEPVEGDCKVSAKAGWTEKHEVEIEPVMVTANPDLFQAAAQKKENEEFAEKVKASEAAIRETGRATLSVIQRKLKVEPEEAAKIMEALEEKGVVSAPGDDGAREIL